MTNTTRFVVTGPKHEADAEKFWNPTLRQENTDNSISPHLPITAHSKSNFLRSNIELLRSTGSWSIAYSSWQSGKQKSSPDLTPMVDPKNHQYFRLLDLPTELRINIFAQALTVGKVFYSPTPFELHEGRRFDKYKEYEKPNVTLLRVCRQVRNEAEPIYLSTNLFVLPPQFIYCSPFRKPVEQHLDHMHQLRVTQWNQEFKDRPLFSQKGLQLVRNISITLCSRGDTTHAGMTRTVWNKAGIHLLDFQDRRQFAHDVAEYRLTGQWQVMMRALNFLRAAEGYLEIDYSNSFCTIGCRRYVFVDHEVIEMQMPKCVRLLDTTFLDSQNVDDEGMTYLVKQWVLLTGMTMEDLKVKFGLVVDGEDVWEGYISASNHNRKTKG